MSIAFTQSHYYRIGSGHTYCEDYALATIFNGPDLTLPYNPIAIVSDGCSSMEHTDIGARLLTYEAVKRLRPVILAEKFPLTRFRRQIERTVRATGKRIGCDWTALGATLLGAFVMRDTCYIFGYGDGYWFHRNVDGRLTVSEIEYSGNAPPYLIYPEITYEKFVRDFGGEAYIKTRVRDLYDEDAETNETRRARQFLHTFPLDETAEFGVATDGFGSFANAYGIDGIDMLISVLNQSKHPSKHIAFQVAETLNQNPALRHQDDIGIAIINVERNSATATNILDEVLVPDPEPEN